MGVLLNPFVSFPAGGYSPVYTPPSISSASYMQWCEARHETYSDNDPVSILHDQSGNGNHWTQATSGEQPIFKTGIVNSQAVIRFDGSDDSLTLALDILSGKSAGEVFIVVKVDNDPPGASAQSGLWNQDGDGTNACHYPFTDGTIYEAWGSTSRKTAVNPTPSLASWRLYNVASAASDFKIRLDGTQIYSTGTNTFASFSSPIRLGRSDSLFGNVYLDGDIALIAIVDAVLNSTDRDAIEAEIASIYGLTIA